MNERTNPEKKYGIIGTGLSLPDNVITNDWFVSRIDTNDEWIRTRTGIHERRFAGADQKVSDFAYVLHNGCSSFYKHNTAI